MSEVAAVIHVVDDDRSVRRGLSRLLQSAGFSVETYGLADEYLECSPADGPSCLVLDLHLPGLSGVELQAELLGSGRELPIVFITGVGDIPTSVEAMKAGAVDFLTKPVDEEALLAAVELALEREREQRESETRRQEVQARVRALTPRELDVMRCVISGALNKQVATHLGIAEKTVKVHRGRVMSKMDVDSVAALVRTCGLVGVGPIAVN